MQLHVLKQLVALFVQLLADFIEPLPQAAERFEVTQTVIRAADRVAELCRAHSVAIATAAAAARRIELPCLVQGQHVASQVANEQRRSKFWFDVDAATLKCGIRRALKQRCRSEPEPDEHQTCTHPQYRPGSQRELILRSYNSKRSLDRVSSD